MPESRFPLTRSKLPKLQVDAPTVADWMQSAREEILELLADRESWYYKGAEAQPSSNKCVFDKKGVRGYTLSTDGSRKKDFFGEGVLRLSLEDIAYGLYCDETRHQRRVNAYFDAEYFLDAAVLDVYAHRTPEDPFLFAGVKWAAYNSPPGVVTQYTDHDATTKSDFVFFEYSCKTRDAEGKVLLVQYIASPPLTPEELKEHHTGLARGKHTQISTFRYMDEGTQFRTMGSFEVGKPVPAWVSMKSVLQAFGNVTSLVGLADTRAVSSLGVASAMATTKTCSSCKKKFGLMRPRINCYACGQCVCKQCTLKLRVINDKALFSTSLALLSESKFCLHCVRQSRERRPERGSFCEVSSSMSSLESTATIPTSFDELALHSSSSSSSNVDYWDDDDDSDEYPVPLSRRFDRNGAHRIPAVKASVHRPVYTDEEVSIKGSSRTLSRTLSPTRQQQQPPRRQTSQPKVSAVEAFLARTKAEQQRAADAKTATTSRRHARSAGDSPVVLLSPSVMPTVATNERSYSVPVESASVPVPAAAASSDGTDMFSKLTESLAAQEKLLLSIQQEAQRIRTASGDVSRLRAATNIPESDRFEVVADA